MRCRTRFLRMHFVRGMLFVLILMGGCLTLPAVRLGKLSFKGKKTQILNSPYSLTQLIVGITKRKGREALFVYDPQEGQVHIQELPRGIQEMWPPACSSEGFWVVGNALVNNRWMLYAYDVRSRYLDFPILPEDVQEISVPGLSPRGHLAVGRVKRNDRWGLYAYDAQSHQLSFPELPENMQIHTRLFAPDGSAVVGKGKRGDGWSLYVYDLRGGHVYCPAFLTEMQEICLPIFAPSHALAVGTAHCNGGQVLYTYANGRVEVLPLDLKYRVREIRWASVRQCLVKYGKENGKEGFLKVDFDEGDEDFFSTVHLEE